MLDLFRNTKVASKPVPIEANLPARPPMQTYKLEKRPADPFQEQHLKEYADLAVALGVKPPELAVENFKALLVRLDLPIFDLQEVIKYMDTKAAAESVSKAGWHWQPLRAKDHMRDAVFGESGEAERTLYATKVITPTSDYYRGPTRRVNADIGAMMREAFGGFDGREIEVQPSTQPYARTVPLHALRRIAAIEKESKDAKFFVSEYAPVPEIRNPDPFLMAVVPNDKLHIGIGRFVIDFWDEPGFGIEQMLNVTDRGERDGMRACSRLGVSQDAALCENSRMPERVAPPEPEHAKLPRVWGWMLLCSLAAWSIVLWVFVVF